MDARSVAGRRLREHLDDAHKPRHRQQDRDAKWMRQRSCSCCGYRRHIGIDREHKLLRRRPVTDAAVHDARVEHVFGHPVRALAAGVVRTIGLQCAAARTLMGNLMYNMRRYRFLVARQA